MKKSLKILIIAGSVVAAILIVVGILTLIAHSRNDNTRPVDELSDWMGKIKDDALLKEIVIPGSHDAGTKGLSYLAETQDKTIAEQLKCGTRYFDLRVAVTLKGLQIYHGPFKGAMLEGILLNVSDFLHAHPTETVILDFQHFDGDAQLKVAKEVLNGWLSSMLVKNTSDQDDVAFVNNLKIGDIRGKVLVVWGDGFDSVKTEGIFKRNDDDGTRENSVIHSYYQTKLNTKASATYCKEVMPYYTELYKKENSGLFVLQGQLTDGMLVFGPRFREAGHCDNMNAFVLSLQKSDDLGYINIIMRDFVSPAKNCLTLNLNLAKNLVKESETAAFRAMLSSHISL